MLEIRLLHGDEIEDLHRFLERSFGHGWGWFYRRRPALARIESMTRHSLIGFHQGKIVSHVGMYPLPLRSGPVNIMCGGIGSVATAPEARGKGYMSQMLPAAVKHMTNLGWPISVLWGDRQRYLRFGWERAGALLHLTLNRRSLAGYDPAPLEDVDPTKDDHVRQVAAFHDQIPFRVERPYLDYMLKAPDLRLFMGTDGYVLSTGVRAGNLHVIEVSSPTGKEPHLIAAAMDRADAGEAHVIMEPVTNSRTKSLLAAAAHWQLESRAMFRILHWYRFLQSVSPWLAERATGLPSFAVSVTCYYSTDDLPEMTATLRWDGQHLDVSEGTGATDPIRLEAREWVRMMLGAPTIPLEGVSVLQRLLPIPLHIPRLDFV